MPIRSCLLCEQVNPAEARFCNLCGAALVMACPRCNAENLRSAAACSACGSVLAPHTGRPAMAARGGAPSTSAAEDLNLTLRPLDDVDPSAAASGPSVAVEVHLAAPEFPLLIHSDPDPDWASLPRSDASAIPPALARSTAKSNRRAAVRRARMAAGQADVSPASSALLVLDEDDDARSRLALMLEGFGFRVQAMRSLAEAEALLDAQAFAAVFAVVALHGVHQELGAEFCRRVKGANSGVPGRAPALAVVADRVRAVDRVRAELLGADAFLLKPLRRGAVVRALEDGGVPLLRDERVAY